ncbi:MAG: DUF131 domain-containing protein [Candidatus Aenigmarchaeota archaeon]|nr:DUF131 domain-containing protein [Candidatus Aenigmarchaeota archaeon]MDW8149637.1 DUF131 domain-containing protein [Candidatus Aenigmarchaeota archaeon]
MESIVIFFIGLLLVITGFFLLFLSLFLKEKSIKIQSGFSLWIGPFPIIGASSREMFYLIVFTSVLIFILFFLLNKLW